MNAIALPYYRNYDLPWAFAQEDRAKLWKIFKRIGIPVLILALVLPFLPSQRVVYETPQAPPPDRIAELIIDKPLPPPPVVEEKPKEKPKKKLVEIKKVKPKVKPKPRPKPEPVAELPPPPVDERAAARERASNAGVMAMQNELAALSDFSGLQNLSTATTSSTAGSQNSSTASRSLITSNNPARASGGINTSNISRGTGGSGLSDRTTTTVQSPVSTSRGSAAASTARSSSGKASRSREEIERVFDQNKSAIYAIYNRALRSDPTLEGKLVLELTIAPSGAVTACRVVSSELNSAELESKLVRRIKLFNFGAKDVEAVTTTKPIDFFPA